MGKVTAKIINGVDSDSSFELRDNQSAYFIENFKIVGNSGNDGSLQNIKGNKTCITTPTNYYFIGVGEIDIYALFFMKSTANPYLLTIALVKKTLINGTSFEINLTDFYFNDDDVYHKLFEDTLGVNTTTYKDLNFVTNIENDTSKKIYFTLTDEPFRSINIVNSDSNDIISLTSEDLEAIPYVQYTTDFNAPILNKTTSGSLKSGIIQYGYKLIKANGAESQLSPLSNTFHLTKASDTSQNTSEYHGSGYDINTGKGVFLEILNIPDEFETILVYSIHYLNEYDLPSINLIFQGNVSTNMYISDVGVSLGTIAPEEFISQNISSITSGIIETKSNYMFLANYDENYFDIDEELGSYWDARAYSFGTVGTYGASSYVYDSDLVTFIQVKNPVDGTYGGAIAWNDVPVTHDCINKTNDLISESINYHYNQNFQSDGVTYGAEGKNLKFLATYHSIQIDEVPLTAQYYRQGDSKGTASPNFSYAGHASPDLAGSKKFYLPGDVYRLGIQFINEKGSISTIKWVTDYRIPEILEASSDNRFYTYDGKTSYTGVDLSFTLKNPPVNPNTGIEYLYRICIVKRSDADISIRHGVIRGMYPKLQLENSGFFNYPSETNLNDAGFYENIADDTLIFASTYTSLSSLNTGIPSPTIVEFISPDYCYGSKINIDKIKVDTRESITGSFPLLKEVNSRKNVGSKKLELPAVVYSKFSPETSGKDGRYISIDNYITIEAEDDIRFGGGYSDIAGTNIYNMSIHYVDGSTLGGSGNYLTRHSIKGRTIVLEMATPQVDFYQKMVYAHAISDNFLSRYGGLSHDVRLYSSYIPISGWLDPLNSTTQKVYGDSTVSMFDYLGSQYNEGLFEYSVTGSGVENQTYSEATGCEILYFPIVSNVNTSLTSGTIPSRESNDPSVYLMKETAGIHTLDGTINDVPYSLSFEQETDLYLYNLTYSKIPDLFQYYETRDSDIISQDIKYRINASYKKVSGETVDNWLRFNPSTFVDVESRYGEIVKLFTFKNRLYFAQEKSIGIAAVNEKATTATVDSGSTVIGQLDVLSRYDYITNGTGISYKEHLMCTDNNVYWYDKILNKIFRLSENGAEDLTISKKATKLLEDVTVKSDNPNLVYNPKTREILFVCTHDSETKVLVYDEKINAFTGVYGYNMNIYGDLFVDAYGKQLITGANICAYIDENYYNKFDYSKTSSVVQKSYVKIQINPQNKLSNLYNTLSIVGRLVFDDGTFDKNNLITSIRVFNDGDTSAGFDTGEVDVYNNSKLKNRFDTYRFNEIRNSSDNARILGRYVNVELGFEYQAAVTNPDFKLIIDQIMVAFTEVNPF